jgi:hypothetical protein
MEVIFDNIASRIQQEIQQANHSVYIAMVWFTNQEIFEKLIQKAKEDVEIYLMI